MCFLSAEREPKQSFKLCHAIVFFAHETVQMEGAEHGCNL